MNGISPNYYTYNFSIDCVISHLQNYPTVVVATFASTSPTTQVQQEEPRLTPSLSRQLYFLNRVPVLCGRRNLHRGRRDVPGTDENTNYDSFVWFEPDIFPDVEVTLNETKKKTKTNRKSESSWNGSRGTSTGAWHISNLQMGQVWCQGQEINRVDHILTYRQKY